MSVIKHIHQIRVPYYDTDKMAVVYHANYIKYFETGRTELLRAQGMSNRHIEEQGYYFPLLSASAEYHWPAVYDDLLDMETTLDTQLGVRITFNYRIFRGEQLLCSGSTTHCFTQIENMKPCRPPKFFVDFIKSLETK